MGCQRISQRFTLELCRAMVHIINCPSIWALSYFNALCWIAGFFCFYSMRVVGNVAAMFGQIGVDC